MFSAAGGVGAGGAALPEVGKLEKDRGVGFGEAPLDARPATSIQARKIPAGPKHLFPIKNNAANARPPRNQDSVHVLKGICSV